MIWDGVPYLSPNKKTAAYIIFVEGKSTFTVS